MIFFIVLGPANKTLVKVKSIFANPILSNSFSDPINNWLAIRIMDKILGSQCKTIFEFYQLFYSQTTGSFTATETPWISWSLIGQKCELRGLKVKSFKFIFWTDYSLFIKTVPASNLFHLITVFEKDYIILFIFQLMKLKKVLYNWVSWLYFSIIYHHFTLFFSSRWIFR